MILVNVAKQDNKNIRAQDNILANFAKKIRDALLNERNLQK